MDLRRTFNENENNYNKARPAYPDKLFEDIFNYTNLSENSNVLERDYKRRTTYGTYDETVSVIV